MKRRVGILGISILFMGCVPTPQPNIGIGTGIGTSVGTTQVMNDPEYGDSPRNYATSIRNYFSAKLPRANKANFKFSEPKRAFKKKGLAYGGELAWKGWMVKTLIAIPSRTGRLTRPKPYIVLFSGNQIVEDILGTSHRLLTQVDK